MWSPSGKAEFSSGLSFSHMNMVLCSPALTLLFLPTICCCIFQPPSLSSPFTLVYDSIPLLMLLSFEWAWW